MVMAADRRYKTRKRPYEGWPHVLRVRILEKFLSPDEITKLVEAYKLEHRKALSLACKRGQAEHVILKTSTSTI